jgi:tRNA threonylcarbamoyladenosine biosynthesis protein TsaE
MNDAPEKLVIESHSVDETMALGAAVAGLVRPGDTVALIGELGAGKTQFVRGLAEGLGIEPQRVSSPTFVFLQEYDRADSDADALVVAHVDAYRLSGTDDLASIGWEGDGEELRRGAVLVVEWADRIEAALSGDRLDVRITHNGEGRTVEVTGHGSWRGRVAGLSIEQG